MEPGIGIASYSYSIYDYIARSGQRVRRDSTTHPGYYLVRFRAIDQFSGLQITIGGEVRGFFKRFDQSINVYLGLRADLAKWFKKE